MTFLITFRPLRDSFGRPSQSIFTSELEDKFEPPQPLPASQDLHNQDPHIEGPEARNMGAWLLFFYVTQI